MSPRSEEVDASAATPIASIVIPAHDEEAVIGRCLRALLAAADPGEFEVVVAANGCTDQTVPVAREVGGPDVLVLDLPTPGKIAALNAADAVARVFPRIYLDADVVLSTASARVVVDALTRGPALVAAPRPHPVTDRCSRLVAWHYSVWADLPVIRDGYVGSGVYAVSAAGHARMAPFPDVIADDQYVRRRFRRSERIQVASTFDFFPPTTIRAVVHRAARARAGNTTLDTEVRDLAPEESPRGLAGLLPQLRHLRRWPAVLTFVSVTSVIRALGARKVRSTGARVWNRDESSRGVA